MDDILKKIEKEIIDEYNQKLTSQDGVTRSMKVLVKISAEITRKFIEKYEKEKDFNQ